MKRLLYGKALWTGLAVLLLALFLVPAPAPEPAQAKVLPPGSYRNSCKDCYVENGWLYCRCKNNRDGRNDTRIHYTRCNGDIANQGGWLTCNGGGGGIACPAAAGATPAGTPGCRARNCWPNAATAAGAGCRPGYR